jgi:hypothetical protein
MDDTVPKFKGKLRQKPHNFWLGEELAGRYRASSSGLASYFQTSSRQVALNLPAAGPACAKEDSCRSGDVQSHPYSAEICANCGAATDMISAKIKR